MPAPISPSPSLSRRPWLSWVVLLLFLAAAVSVPLAMRESLRAFDHSAPAVTIKAGSLPSTIVRFLMVGEVTVMYMLSQGREWFEPTTLFKDGDEGSMGEGLSRFLAGQYFPIFHQNGCRLRAAFPHLSNGGRYLTSGETCH